MDKSGLIKEFQRKADHYWKVPLFEEKGFVRKQCQPCKKFFWSLDPDRKTCADSSCEPYGFIGNPITKKKWDYVKTWKEFEKFFKKEGHTSVPRYPVVDRWRPDLFFTIASIQDFQRIDQGQVVMEYPADPLIVPQVCLRFPDVDNVGLTGRHLTSFIMSGQHSFGNYWKERCIELNFKFFHETMGIPSEKLVYHEDLWAMGDFSQFGPSLETASMGLELSNSVFSQFTAKGSQYEELPIKVIDVGFGHNRLVWFSQGTTTVYEAVFEPIVKWLKKETGMQDSPLFEQYARIAGALDFDEKQNAKIIKKQIAQKLGVTGDEMEKAVEPLQALYSIADHTKTLLFAATDGGIPSNIGGGYNLRVILRRALSFMKEQQLDIDLVKVGELHVKHLKSLFPELKDGVELFEKVLAIERERYNTSLAKGQAIVKRELEKGIQSENLLTLYTSHGIPPETVQRIAKDSGKQVEVPEDFYSQVTQHHLAGKREAEKQLAINVAGTTDTKRLYDDDAYQKEMEAEVVETFSFKGHWVALNQTVFYPEGGGQPPDKGVLFTDDIEAVVEDVQKIGSVVLHRVSKPLTKGLQVKGRIDWDRRRQLMSMHDATHILVGACRRVLGQHAWQAGAQKGIPTSRLDITHYQPFTAENVQAIERMANEIVKKNITTKVQLLPRKQAESRFGFTLYQGGASPGKEVRVVEIPGHDAEACAGTHSHRTGEVGLIKIVRTERIQDGVNRLVFAAGPAAQAHVFKREEQAQEIRAFLEEAGVAVGVSPEEIAAVASLYSIDPDHLLPTIKRFMDGVAPSELTGKSLTQLAPSLFQAWKNEQKQRERESKEQARDIANRLEQKIKDKKVFDILAGERKELILIAGHLLKKHPEVTVILANQAGDLIGMSNTEDMGTAIRELCQRAGGAGGGSRELGQGKVKLSKLMNIMD